MNFCKKTLQQQCGNCAGFKFNVYRRDTEFHTECIKCLSATKISISVAVSTEWTEGSEGRMTNKFSEG